MSSTGIPNVCLNSKESLLLLMPFALFTTQRQMRTYLEHHDAIEVQGMVFQYQGNTMCSDDVRHHIILFEGSGLGPSLSAMLHLTPSLQ